MPSFLPLTTLRSRVFLTIAVLVAFIAIALPLYFRVLSAGNPSVVINKYFNSGTAAGDIVELLVIQNNLDMRGMIVKDFSASMVNDGGGKVQFTTNALWSSVPAGTLIVLRNNNSAADTTVGGGDFNLDVGITNTTYFSSLGGTFDIAGIEMVMIKSAGSGAAGVTGSIHALAGGTAGAQFNATAPPKLIATGQSGTNQFVFANNSTQSINDFDGTDATGAATGLTFGAGNNANNTAYINSLRSGPPNQAIVPTCPGTVNTQQGIETSAGVSATDPDGTVTSATITSAPVVGIALDGFTPAGGVNGVANATLNVANTTAQGNYSVVIQWANSDSPTPQTANCTVTVNVTPAATPTPTPTPSPGSVVISQVYGGGGNAGATLKQDFIELLNHTGAPIDLTGWSVQYNSATESDAWDVTPLSGSIAPGHYYLIQQSQGANGTVDIPTPDATGTILMSATNAKIALVASTTPLTGACPNPATRIDLVGYGTATCFEGSGAVGALSNTTAALRGLNGCLDTDNNATDLTIGAPNPRNSASPPTDCTALAGVGSASPSSILPGDSTTLSVQVFPALSPPSTGISVSADLTSIGGPPNQAFNFAGGNIFNFLATVGLGTSAGLKVLPVTITDAQARTANATISLNIQAEHIVISQIYGAGGNNGAVLNNDYVELYNPTNTTFTITGWSLQYAAATGTTWTNKQPLGGMIGPGKYYLVKLASGGDDGAALPPSQISGNINMAAGAGKVALVNNSDFLSGGCPLGSDSNIVDFVGYGTTATCREGTANAPPPNTTMAIFRANGGETDTDQNGADFILDAPNPRQTEPIVELGPWVSGTDPFADGSDIPYDATVTIDFSEPVDVTGAWYNISCNQTGLHNNATVAMFSNFQGYHITPNMSFNFGEICTVTIFKNQVSDQDTDDSGADTDHLFSDLVFTFTVTGAGAPAPYPPSVHLALGNPSNAIADLMQPNNYLMEKPAFSLSYNRDKGTPNWVSWHLETDWFGGLAREDTFRADPKVDPTWYRVQSTDYIGSGFDRGHMTPNADRNDAGSIPLNQETFLMSNMIPQAPDNNQGPWANMEGALRTLLTSDGGPYEMYIVSGPLGIGGTGSNGPRTTLANGNVTVPAFTWKVVLMIPKGNNDLSRITPGTRTIAVKLPNIQGIRPDNWQDYLTTVDAIEQDTGYDFFSAVSDSIEKCIEAGINGDNPPCTDNSSATTAEDNSVGVTLPALQPDPGDTLTYEIVDGPDHGNLTGSGANRTYQPNGDFNGTDSFTFRVSDGSHFSNVSTVTITVTEVNDAPTATGDSDSTDEDTALDIVASTLTANDSAGPANESSQTLMVNSVTPTGDTHGTVTLNSGTIHYSPDSNYNGPATFEYQVCDNGTTNGGSDPLCSTATVSITVNPVNDNPDAINDTPTVAEDSGANTIDVRSNDVDVDNDTLTITAVTQGTHGSVAITNGGTDVSYTPNDNFFGSDSFTYTVSDGNGGSDTATVNVSVTNVNDAPVLTSSVAMSLMSSTNSNLFNVGLAASATDQEGETVTIQVAVFGDEDDQTPTSNNTVHSPDAKDIAPTTLRLRGERVEANDGRVYLIVVTATDTSGGVSRNYHTVVVPKSNKQANVDSVNAQAAAAVAYASSHAGTPPPGYFVIGDGPIIGPKQ